jgi:hypothetical protein
LPFSHPKRSPHQAPFQNALKSAVFCQTDEIKQSHIAVLRLETGSGWVFIGEGNKCRYKAAMARLKALYGAQFGLCFGIRGFIRDFYWGAFMVMIPG